VDEDLKCIIVHNAYTVALVWINLMEGTARGCFDLQTTQIADQEKNEMRNSPQVLSSRMKIQLRKGVKGGVISMYIIM
jgi:hypothetical protein